MSLSARDRVVHTPELLRYIFQPLDDPENLANALVCKTWCSEALNVLWRLVWSFGHLYKLLAPLELEGHQLVFSRGINPEDWARFNQYSWRVHELVDDGSCEDYHISVLTAISSTRPSTELLPNLRKLEYNFSPPQFLPMFLSQSLRELRLQVSDDEPPNVMENMAMAIQYLPSRAPHLISLTLGSTLATNPIKPAFSKAIAALPRITTLEVPSNLLTLANSAIIASLPALQTWTVKHPYPQTAPLASFLPPSLSDDTFLSLRSLSLAIPFHYAVDWLSQAPNLPVLTDFQLRPVDVATTEHYGRLIQGIGASLPTLERLSVYGFLVPDSEVRTGPITFAQLEPIGQCVNLKHLRLDHPLPFQLHRAHILCIVKSLPSLISLSLNPSPRKQLDLSPSLDLDVLPALIPFCPNLTSLSLYLDARNPPRLKKEGTFQRLRSLDVGCSPVGDTIKAASFLSAILGNGCRILAFSSRADNDGRWNQVKRLVPAFIDVREDEREALESQLLPLHLRECTCRFQERQVVQ